MLAELSASVVMSDGTERDPRRDGDVRADAVRCEREGDRCAGDADVPRRQRMPARSSGRDDQHGGGERPVDPNAAAIPVAAVTRSAIESPTQPAIRRPLRGHGRARGRHRAHARTSFPAGSRARHAIAAAAALTRRSTAIGQRGSTPLADANASTTASHIARTALSEPAIPPTVQSRPSLWRTREKRAKRTAVPIRAGASAFTIEPVQ